jgi:hypothetical protein
MSLTASSLPPGFSWLSPTYRPSPQEVETYVQYIADAEGDHAEPQSRRREAELQLWIWRSETRQRAQRRRSAA